MRGVISWNGQRSDQFGISVEKYPNFKKPQRKFDKYSVPGRNGDIIMMQDAWDDIDQSYEIFAGDGAKHSAPRSFGRVSEWLYSVKGYCELWDEFDPEHYRLAYFTGPFDVETLSIGRIGRTTITFRCKPQRYLISGKEPVVINSAPGTIYNHTAYDSSPLIFVERSAQGSGMATIGETIFTISNIPSNGIYIDCEKMNCYDGNGGNANSLVSSNSSDFAKLKPGENAIGFTGSIARVTITPRWFEI